MNFTYLCKVIKLRPQVCVCVRHLSNKTTVQIKTCTQPTKLQPITSIFLKLVKKPLMFKKKAPVESKQIWRPKWLSIN